MTFSVGKDEGSFDFNIKLFKMPSNTEEQDSPDILLVNIKHISGPSNSFQDFYKSILAPELRHLI